MSLEIPTQEQTLYAHLAVLDALACSIRDNSMRGAFNDDELYGTLCEICEDISSAHYRMKYLLKKSKEKKIE